MLCDNKIQRMIHLRTDLPIVPDQEMDGWVQDIVENTHYHDLQILRQRLDEAIQSNDNEMTNLSVTKKCTKRDKESPEFIDTCKCGNTNLETVQLHYNIY